MNEDRTSPEVIDRLARIETKLDSHLSMYRDRSDDHERRLRRLERFCWLALGIASASGTGTLAALLGH